MKIKLGPEALSVNDKTAPIMYQVLSIVYQYHAEMAHVNSEYNIAQKQLDEQLKNAQRDIEARYEQRLLGAYKT